MNKLCRCSLFKCQLSFGKVEASERHACHNLAGSGLLACAVDPMHKSVASRQTALKVLGLGRGRIGAR